MSLQEYCQVKEEGSGGLLTLTQSGISSLLWANQAIWKEIWKEAKHAFFWHFVSWGRPRNRWKLWTAHRVVLITILAHPWPLGHPRSVPCPFWPLPLLMALQRFWNHQEEDKLCGMNSQDLEGDKNSKQSLTDIQMFGYLLNGCFVRRAVTMFYWALVVQCLLSVWEMSKCIISFETCKTLRGDKALLEVALFAYWGQNHSCSIFLLPLDERLYFSAPMKWNASLALSGPRNVSRMWHSRKSLSSFSTLLCQSWVSVLMKWRLCWPGPDWLVWARNKVSLG